MTLLRLLPIAVLLSGCLGPLQLPEFPDDDDDSSSDDDDTGPDDDDTGPDDDDTVVTGPEGLTSRLCSGAGLASDAVYTARTCTGPVEAAPGRMSDGVFTLQIEGVRFLSPGGSR